MEENSFSARLQIVHGENEGEIFELKSPTRLGRERDNDLIFTDARISRYHAMVEKKDSDWIIRDLGSANGTFVNGAMVSAPTILKQGDLILLGETELSFTLESTKHISPSDQTVTNFKPAKRPQTPEFEEPKKPERRKSLWIGGGIVVVLVIVAIAAVLLFPRGPKNGNQAAPPGAPNAPAQTSSEEAGLSLVYEDDFSDPSSGWEDAFTKYITKQYGNNKYHIVISSSNLWAWGLANRRISDFVLQVEAAPQEGPTNNGYGLIFRFVDKDNFYRFAVSGDGFYSLSKLEKGEWSSLIDWKESPQIKKAFQTNTLKVRAVGPEISVYANGVELASIKDTSFSSGDFGFFASTFSEANPPLWITFDDVKVWAPKGVIISMNPTPDSSKVELTNVAPQNSSAVPESTEAAVTAQPTMTQTATAKPTASKTAEALPQFASRDQPLGHGQTPLTGYIYFPLYDGSHGVYDIYRAQPDGEKRELIQSEASQPDVYTPGKTITFRSWKADQRGLISRKLGETNYWRYSTLFEAGRPKFSPDGNTFLLQSWQEKVPSIYRTMGEKLEVVRRDSVPVNGEAPAWTPDGKFVYRGCLGEHCGLIINNIDGSDAKLITNDATDTNPAVSPDGKYIAFMSHRDGNWEVYLTNPAGEGLQRLTNDGANDGLPAWSPDSKDIAFVSDRDNTWAVYAIQATGGDLRQLFPLNGSINGTVKIDEQNSHGWLEETIVWTAE